MSPNTQKRLFRIPVNLGVRPQRPVRLRCRNAGCCGLRAVFTKSAEEPFGLAIDTNQVLGHGAHKPLIKVDQLFLYDESHLNARTLSWPVTSLILRQRMQG
jgi:hypothetical protein